MSDSGGGNGNYSFANDLWDGMKAVVDNADNGQKTLKSLVKFVKDQSELCLSQGKSLKKLSKKAAISSAEREGHTFHNYCSALSGLVETVALNNEILAAKLTEQVAKPLESLRDRNAAAVKTLTGQALDLQRQYKDGLKKLTDARDKCQQACSLADQARIAEKQAMERGGTAEQLRELTASANNASKRAIAEDQKYVQAVKFMRGFRTQHDVMLADILDKFQQTEQQRLSLTCQYMEHYMTVMRSMVQSEQKNTLAVTGVLHEVDVQADIQSFIRAYKTDRARPPLPEYQVFKGHPMYDGKEGSPDIDDDTNGGNGDGKSSVARRGSDTNSGSGGIVPHETEKSESRITAEVALSGYFEKLLKTHTLDETDLRVIRQLFKTADGRDAFAFVLNQQRRNNAGLILPREAYDALAKLILDFLDQAQASMHVNPAQLVMIMSQTFFRWKDDDEKTDKDRENEAKWLAREAKAKADKEKRDAVNAAATAATAAAATAATEASASASTSEKKDDSTAPATATMDGDSKETKEAKSDDKQASSPTTTVSVTEFLENDDDDDTAGALRPRLYLFIAIQNHGIWKDLRFWEEAFFEQISTKLKTHRKLHRWHSDAEQADALHTQRNVVFSCLGTFAHNMRDFGMDQASVITFVNKMASIHELDDSHIQMLTEMECLAPPAGHPKIRIDPHNIGAGLRDQPSSSTSTATSSSSPESSTSTDVTSSPTSDGEGDEPDSPRETTSGSGTNSATNSGTGASLVASATGTGGTKAPARLPPPLKQQTSPVPSTAPLPKRTIAPKSPAVTGSGGAAPKAKTAAKVAAKTAAPPQSQPPAKKTTSGGLSESIGKGLGGVFSLLGIGSSTPKASSAPAKTAATSSVKKAPSTTGTGASPAKTTTATAGGKLAVGATNITPSSPRRPQGTRPGPRPPAKASPYVTSATPPSSSALTTDLLSLGDTATATGGSESTDVPASAEHGSAAQWAASLRDHHRSASQTIAAPATLTKATSDDNDDYGEGIDERRARTDSNDNNDSGVADSSELLASLHTSTSGHGLSSHATSSSSNLASPSASSVTSDAPSGASGDDEEELSPLATPAKVSSNTSGRAPAATATTTPVAPPSPSSSTGNGDEDLP